MCTVILFQDGIRRYYKCETYFDGVVLMDLITASNRDYGRVELWSGDTMEIAQEFGVV